jgi:hypothetical protein
VLPSHAVARKLLLAAVLCLSFEMSGLAALCGDSPCEDCPLERSGGQCAPNCHACECCSLPKTTNPVPVVEAPTEHGQGKFEPFESTVPGSPEPSEIFRVPKLLDV